MEREQTGGYLARPRPSGLADVVELVLDKGVVIDAYAQVSVIGIQVLSLDARIVVSSANTYLRFAEATNRLDLSQKGGIGLPELLTEGTEEVVTDLAARVVEDKVDSALDTVGDTLGEPAEKIARSATKKAAGVVERVVAKAITVVEDAEEQ